MLGGLELSVCQSNIVGKIEPLLPCFYGIFEGENTLPRSLKALKLLFLRPNGH